MKRFLNFIIGKFFKKKIPLANWDNYFPPIKCEETSLNVETVATEVLLKREYLIPDIVWKREIANVLAKELIPYIKYEVTEDIYHDGVRYRGVIRIVKER